MPRKQLEAFELREKAFAAREKAARARQLAERAPTQPAADDLKCIAVRLEARASGYERQMEKIPV